ncbi:IS3 family transposase [Metabacillus niabensis]|uniref:IS3 family transposase n=1 Tax=Metabacillus niabensis TaxID=324854 RepID=UPI001583C835
MSNPNVDRNYSALKKLRYCVNHKKVYRLMRGLGLKCVKLMRKSRKYNSYKGKVW